MAQDESKTATDSPGQEAPPQWTVMVYLAGDNSLSAQCVAIMQELEAVEAGDNVRVLACFDSNTPRPKGSRYLEFKRARNRHDTGIAWSLHNDLITPEERGHETFAPDFCNPDPARVRQPEEPVAAEGLTRFLNWAMQNHRAERHMLVLFGHGTAVAGQTFLVDDNPPSFLRLEELSRILGQHFGGKDADGNDRKKLDILACNNCVMNGIETAYEVRNQVELMLGSQGLMLAVGWPYRRILQAVVNNAAELGDVVAGEVLKVCARNLLDFSLMDRSLEQSVCDLSKFDGDGGGIVASVRALSQALQEGLRTDGAGQVVFPQVRDAVRLARLEAQSFWDETFVDLYDFCELLLDRCRDAVSAQDSLLQSLLPEEQKESASKQLVELPAARQLNDIARRCRALLADIEDAVPVSYYIGPELQYSHGLSIYFPWVLPEGPYFYEPVRGRDAQEGEPKDFRLKTVFDIYSQYSFCGAADWGNFLVSFFRATLRNVRRFDKKYKESDDLREMDPTPTNEANAFPVNLQKSSSDVSREDDGVGIRIKNYPRRNYLSPADCLNKTSGTSVVRSSRQFSEKDLVSYLGWNLRGLVAEVVKPSAAGDGSPPAGKTPDSPAPSPGSPAEG